MKLLGRNTRLCFLKKNKTQKQVKKNITTKEGIGRQGKRKIGQNSIYLIFIEKK